jgi:sRNA-binding protein
MRDDYYDAVRRLSDHFPKAIFYDGRLWRPLKKTIVADIIREIKHGGAEFADLKDMDVEAVVGWYNSHYGMQKNSALAGTPRINLAGEPDGSVTPQEALFHRSEINRINSEKNVNGIGNPHDY